MDFATCQGPLISARQRETVLGYIKKGVEEGAKVAVGGKRPEHLAKGYYVEPTIFVDVKNSMTIAQEEIFGPVLCVIRYKTIDEAIRMANDSIYGPGGAGPGRRLASLPAPRSRPSRSRWGRSAASACSPTHTSAGSTPLARSSSTRRRTRSPTASPRRSRSAGGSFSGLHDTTARMRVGPWRAQP